MTITSTVSLCYVITCLVPVAIACIMYMINVTCFSPPCSPFPQHTHTNTSPPHPATPLCQHGDLQDEVDRLNTQLLSLKISNEREMEEVRRVQRRELEQLNEKYGIELRRKEDEKVQEE